jgi:hypothetical protein
MRTLLIVEDNPHFVLVKHNRATCSVCGRSIGTYLSREDGNPRAFWHRSNSGSGTFDSPISWRKCPGSGKAVQS